MIALSISFRNNCCIKYIVRNNDCFFLKYSNENDRIDVDSALSFRLTENFKIFGGYKYQRSNITLESVVYQRGSTNVDSMHEKMEIAMPANGPAVGLGFSAPLGDRYFIAANFSALYMWSSFDFGFDETRYNGSANLIPSTQDEVPQIKTVQRGINFEPTIGASMGEGMPIFTLGVRGQWSQIKMLEAEDIGVEEKWFNDYQYGIFVSILYPF